jgi:type I restriction enzyme S subunit
MDKLTIVKVKDVSKQIRGVSYTPKDVSDIQEEGYVRLLRANNIKESGLDITDSVFVRSNCISDLQKLRKGDILITASSGSKKIVGRSILIESDINSSFGAFCKVIRPNSKVDYRYLSYYFRSPDYRSKISHISSGANINNLKNEDLDNLEIPLPPLPIQKKIADILDKADALRRADKELLQKYDQLAQAIFIDMFGDPELNTKNFVQTEMGKEVQFIGGSQPPKSTFSYRLHENYIRLIQIRDYKSDRFLTYIPKDKARRFCTKDDIMIGRYGPPVFQILRGLEGAYNVALMKAVPGPKIGKEFLFSLLSSAYLQNIIIGNSQRTSGQTGVNLEILEKIKIFLPPMELQQKFEKRVSLIHKLHRLQNNILIQSETAFNSLIQKAFAGELE